jgi:hypothetical protein
MQLVTGGTQRTAYSVQCIVSEPVQGRELREKRGRGRGERYPYSLACAIRRRGMMPNRQSKMGGGPDLFDRH